MSFEATFTGNAGGDPQEHTFQSGDSVAQVSVGVNQGYKDRQTGDWVDQGTMWVRVTLPSGVDPTRIRKGDRLLVTGPIRQRQYTAKDGTQRTSLDCRARQLAIVPRVPRQGQPQQQSQQSAWRSGQAYAASQQQDPASQDGFGGGF